jgi:hypothetical protein
LDGRFDDMFVNACALMETCEPGTNNILRVARAAREH